MKVRGLTQWRISTNQRMVEDFFWEVRQIEHQADISRIVSILAGKFFPNDFASNKCQLFLGTHYLSVYH